MIKPGGLADGGAHTEHRIHRPQVEPQGVAPDVGHDAKVPVLLHDLDDRLATRPIGALHQLLGNDATQVQRQIQALEKQRQEIKRLLDPDGMGSDLKMLVQGRGELADAAAEIFDNDP